MLNCSLLKNCSLLSLLYLIDSLPGPPRSMNEIFKSRQHMHDNSLQMQFFEPASFCRLPSAEPDIKSDNNINSQ